MAGASTLQNDSFPFLTHANGDAESALGGTSEPLPKPRGRLSRKVFAGCALASGVAAMVWLRLGAQVGAHVTGDGLDATELNMNGHNRKIWIKIDHSSGAPLGISVDHDFSAFLEIAAVRETGLIHEWNVAHPSRVVTEHCKIVQVNGIKDDMERILAELQKKDMFLIQVELTGLGAAAPEVMSKNELPCNTEGSQTCCLGPAGYFCTYGEDEARGQAMR
mmetsp:Transcript_83995/g.271476  ORF Transcript_83995/g.271476 Transcript_83995/m.271476 type:complete len:220 (+) Transcript_83995:58-717(+)